MVVNMLKNMEKRREQFFLDKSEFALNCPVCYDLMSFDSWFLYGMCLDCHVFSNSSIVVVEKELDKKKVLV